MAYKGNDFFPLFPILPNYPVVLTASTEKQISLTLPAAGATLSGISIAGSAPSGTIYLDQMVASYLGVVDSEAPEVTMALADTALTATLTDAVEGKVSADNISLTYDGAPLTFTLSASSLTAPLPAPDGVSHRISLTARQ